MNPGWRMLWHRIGVLQARFPVLQVVMLVLVFVYGAYTVPDLATWINIKLVAYLACIVALVGAGQTMLILMGGFDLSVVGFMALGSMTVVLAGRLGISFGVALLIILAVAFFVGAAAGQICHRLGLNPLIITLGTGAIATGAAQVILGGPEAANAYSAPEWLIRLASPASTTFGTGIPPVVAITLAAAVLLAIFLHRTVIGVRLLATGASITAAEYSLIRTRRIWTATFAFSAIVSTLVGVLLTGFVGAPSLDIGSGYLFLSITAVLVGGTAFGGPGDYTLTLIGAVFLQLLATVLIGHGIDRADQQILYGVILLVALMVYGRERRLRDRI